MQLNNARLVLQKQLRALGISDDGTLSYLAHVARFYESEKDEKIINVGQVPTHFFAVLSGLARYYYLSPDGKEWNKAFFCEGQFIGSLSSFLRRQPCAYTIAALERCHLAAIPVNALDVESVDNPQIQNLLNNYIREIMLRNEEREALLLTCNSEARYLWLLEHQRWLVERVPQYHLASYLGMEPASLSRIKKHLSRSPNR